MEVHIIQLIGVLLFLVAGVMLVQELRKGKPVKKVKEEESKK